jgi:hypothetical protein
MERKYVFHYTAKGFLIFSVGVLCLFFICIYLVFSFPNLKWINFGFLVLLSLLTERLSFSADRRALNKGKGNR